MFHFRTIIQSIIFLLVLNCSSSEIQAQETPRSEPTWWFGAAGAGNLNFYRGTTQMLNSSVTTPLAFHRGYDPGLYVALGAEYRPDPIWGGMLYAGYDNRQGYFDNIFSPYNLLSSLSAKISYITIEPSLRITSPKSGFYVFAGPRLGINMGKSFTYRKSALPADETNGDWSKVNAIVFSGQIGAGFDVPLTAPNTETQVKLSPYVSFQPYFGQNPRSVESWNLATLRVGASLTFGRGDVIPQESPVSIPVASERDVTVSVRAPKIVPAQRRVRETFPLRNYVFFDQGSSEVPNRYVRMTKGQAASFKEEDLQNVQPVDTTGRSNRQLAVYYNILNILGDRMRKNPETNVSLIGASANGPDDGRALAESIKQYLVVVYDIDSTRITVVGRDLPKIPSESPNGKISLALLRAEDRRVDIETQSPNLLMQVGGPEDMLRPVQIANTQDDPLDSHVIFEVAGAKDLLSSWMVEVRDEEGNVQHFGPFTQDRASVPGNYLLGNRAEGSYTYEVFGQTKTGHTIRKSGSIHLMRRDDAKIEGIRFSILFRFDHSKMIATYEKFLTEMVVPQISDSSTVIIHGHTDAIGEGNYNQTLSQDRANDVQRVIEGALANAGKHNVTFDTYGSGDDARVEPFGNTLPEERFYNRTVIIDIVPAR
jgi:outer membrane protein OmpA-like peptidoglycan-associated protein